MDSAGKCTYQNYSPFGGDLGAASIERYKFTGKEDDDAIGLYLLLRSSLNIHTYSISYVLCLFGHFTLV